MALSDILAAIKAQADKGIAVIQESATREKNTIKAKGDEEIAAFEEDLKRQTAAKKVQLKKKAETMVEMDRKKMILEEKRTALDHVYDAALKKLQQLPTEKKKKLIQKLMENVKGQKGDVKEVKEGGFLFVSKNAEEDYSFPHLIENTLSFNSVSISWLTEGLGCRALTPESLHSWTYRNNSNFAALRSSISTAGRVCRFVSNLAMIIEEVVKEI